MATRLLVTAYASVHKNKIAPLAQNCYDNFNGNPNFPNGGPLALTLRDALDKYVAMASITSPTPAQTAETRQRRTTLDAALTAVAKHANDLFPTNEAVLLTAGLPLTKQREKHTTLLPPTAFKVGDGNQSGELCAEFKRSRHSAATEVRYTDDPTLPWYLWRVVATTRNKATLRGYARKTEVFVMCRAIGGDTDDQPFSEVVSRVVQ